MRRPTVKPPRPWGLLGGGAPASKGERTAIALLVLLHAALVVALGIAGWTLAKYWNALQLPPWQKVVFEVGIGIAMVNFVIRGVRLLRRLRTRP